MPKSPLPPGSSSPPPGKHKLDETLHGQHKIVERGRKTLSTEGMKAISDDDIAEIVELKMKDDIEDEDTGSARPSSPEAAADLEAGVGVFREAVDTIISSLLLLIGKFELASEEAAVSAKKIAANNKATRWNSLLGILVALGVAFAVYQMREVVKQGQADTAERKAVTAELAGVTAELREMKKAQEATKTALVAVETEAAGKPTIEIVPDDNGGAKVVIRQATPKPVPGAKNHPKHLPPPAAVEIPIKLPPGSKMTKKKAP